jgi:hypothetical protein
MTIKTLFDSSRDIYRTIEKVITYSASQEARLRTEINEYIVTDHIEEQFEKLLSKIQLAMESGGENEVGVWVSGFYGSGKSSFTKYLGFALDERVQVDGVRFLKHLQDRMQKPQTKALLATVASRFPVAVIMLDLASSMLAGATMEDVSTVLYYKVLQWAGYSHNLKVAALERRLQKDGRYAEFEARFQDITGAPWSQYQNDPLVVDSIIPELAQEFYPNLFKTPTAFSTETSDFIRFEDDRVKEMIDIARQASGKESILFIVDEVGQYVGSRPNLILNLDGLAKNLKSIGDGKVWLIATAQQTLTEDDPRASLNSPELFKLSARFPVQIDLESSDIKEICYRRLLGKSPTGERKLGALFDTYGQALRFNTKLQDARFYDADFDKTTFVNLYPFLPAHFEILLHLLGALAKASGGIGLRSAIKVIQDILVEKDDGQMPLAERPVGTLATTVTLYDSLEKEIRSAKPSIHNSVGKVLIRFPDSPVHQAVAKTVAVLQILENMPVTPQNVTSLMHLAVEAPSARLEVDAAIQDLTSDPIVPFGEQDGNLRFFSEKLNDIEQKRVQIPIRTIETRRLQNEALREALSPRPSVQLYNSFAVSSGLKIASGTTTSSLAGENDTIQTVVEFVDAPDYAAARARLLEESRQRANQQTIFLLGRTPADIETRLGEIYRCREIANLHGRDPDQEVKEYCRAQLDRAERLTAELQGLLRRALSQGSFIFRGQDTAVESLDSDLLQAARKHLAGVAEQVFGRYSEAPVRAETGLAERFLRMGNLRAVTAALDPLGLVDVSGSAPSIRREHKALVSIRDYLTSSGTVEGRRLIDRFGDAPFGWSQDTLRYLIAGLLVAGQIELIVSGRRVTVSGQQAIDALRTNNSFKPVGVAWRYDDLPIDMLARAAERLTEFGNGEVVVPLEADISKAATATFTRAQRDLAALPQQLRNLGLPGADTISDLQTEMAELLLADASDAPQRMGGEDSPLYNNLKWAYAVKRMLDNGLASTVQALQHHRQEIEKLPMSGEPGALRADLAEDLDLLRQRLTQLNFYTNVANFNSMLTAIQARTRDTVAAMIEAQRQSVRDAQADLQRLPDWGELNQEEQINMLAQLDALLIQPSTDLAGLQKLLTQEYERQTLANDLALRIERLGYERRMERLRAAQGSDGSGVDGRAFFLTRTLTIPATFTSLDQLDRAIRALQGACRDAELYTEFTITLQFEE